jgi:hypothetical protein
MNGDKNRDAVYLDANNATSTFNVGVDIGNGDGTFQTPRESIASPNHRFHTKLHIPTTNHQLPKLPRSAPELFDKSLHTMHLRSQAIRRATK